jgi:hypothetical protein
MTIRQLTVFYLSLFLLFSHTTLSAENRGLKLNFERLALVIGNSAYKTAPLENPLNDAEDMAATLTNLGFQVIFKKNADQRTMEDAIRYFGKQLRNGGVGLFYYAGHGMQVEGRNYLIPVDARIESENDVKYEAVDAGRVLGQMEDAQSQINIVILDACRNNPFSRNFRTGERGLARMDAPKGSLIAYATAPGEVAADGSERNGIFTKYLMKHMVEPNLPIEMVLKQARIDVARVTGGRQIPWEASSLMGNFYFNPVKSTISTEKVEKVKNPSQSSSTTQVAAIPKIIVNKNEPWTGKWKVEGSPHFSGQWGMKQSGNKVVSNSDSHYDFKGKVSRSQLKGTLRTDGTFFPFVINISQDGQSFKGSIDSYYGWGSSSLVGRRTE